MQGLVSSAVEADEPGGQLLLRQPPRTETLRETLRDQSSLQPLAPSFDEEALEGDHQAREPVGWPRAATTSREQPGGRQHTALPVRSLRLRPSSCARQLTVGWREPAH